MKMTYKPEVLKNMKVLRIEPKDIEFVRRELRSKTRIIISERLKKKNKSICITKKNTNNYDLSLFDEAVILYV